MTDYLRQKVQNSKMSRRCEISQFTLPHRMDEGYRRKHKRINKTDSKFTQPTPRYFRIGFPCIILFLAKGVLYKRRDTLRGRFAYRQQYAVLRFAPPEAASLSSLRRESGSGGVPLPPPPPTLTLLKGRGKSETEKVMSLEVGCCCCFSH